MTTPSPALGDRSLFGRLEAFAYLNHAAISPPSSAVREAALAVLDDYGARGVGAFGRWLEQREGLRRTLGALIGADGGSIAYVPSTTRSVVDLALSLPWERGDRVLCFGGEFPTNVTPWQQAAKTFGLEVVFEPADAFREPAGLELLERRLAEGLRLVAVSAVQFSTGLAMPVAEITERAHAAGAEVFVDAIQACGVVPIDVGASGVDYLGCGSHKWLMGLEGAGFLYVRPERAPLLVPRTAGWLSHEEPLKFLFEGAGHLRYDRPIRKEPSYLESGAQNPVGLAALDASVSLIAALGVPSIFAHVQRYHDALEPALIERGFVSERTPDPARRSGILAARPPEGVDLPTLWRALGDAGVACTIPDGRLRFAPHWPNSLDEIPRVVAALDACLEHPR